jgi:hypothetical protein
MSETIQRTNLEQIQKDTQSPDIDVSVERDGIGGSEQLQSELDAMADSMDVTGFKCVHEKCGLVHEHDTTKHRGSDSFDMSEDEAAQMETLLELVLRVRPRRVRRTTLLRFLIR